MGNDNGEYTCELEYGEHKLHLTATLLNASEGQLEKGIGYLFGIREIAEKIPGFLPGYPVNTSGKYRNPEKQPDSDSNGIK